MLLLFRRQSYSKCRRKHVKRHARLFSFEAALDATLASQIDRSRLELPSYLFEFSRNSDRALISSEDALSMALFKGAYTYIFTLFREYV